MNKVKFNEKHLVVKDNKLIQASYKLGSVEQKIVLSMISKINMKDQEFNVLEFDLDYFAEHIGIKSHKGWVDFLEETLIKLRSKTIVIREPDDSRIVSGWLSAGKIDPDKKKIKLEFSNLLKPYLLQLKEKFTRYQLKAVMNLSGSYSFRIYELVKQFQGGKKEWTVQFYIKQLKKLLMIEKSKTYKYYGEIKRRIINPAQKEINNLTDICIDFEDIKENKLKRGKPKVIGVRFNAAINKQFFIDNSDVINAQSQESKPMFQDLKARDPIRKLSYDIQKQENLIRNLEVKATEDEMKVQRLRLDQLKLERDDLIDQIASEKN